VRERRAPKLRQPYGNVSLPSQGVSGGLRPAPSPYHFTCNLTQGHNNLHNGKITGGSGKFKGVTGKITGTSSGKNNENVTITYHH
jgi:hypothetical protein